ncbi:RTA1 like protein-domain-containing protein [Triangularia verruculosa]|uniref:RTA1 like protein-domain-containing protein n=1 Tax=Triangularia verruculosa TaxID=2587418 RepID=A0AAN6X5C6_9PEZI|nr:RTA1 like protein-domain-containing protein [Triangularia verruculosa]
MGKNPEYIHRPKTGLESPLCFHISKSLRFKTFGILDPLRLIILSLLGIDISSSLIPAQAPPQIPLVGSVTTTTPRSLRRNSAGSMAEEAGGQVPEYRLYDYDPNLPANAVLAVLFSLVTIGQFYLLIRKRTWYFLAFAIACLFEAVGYAARCVAVNEAPHFTLTPFLIQTLCILLAPALMAASIYMVLGRLIRLLDAHEYAIVRTNWLTKIFVVGDVLSFMTQSAGGGMMAQAKDPDAMKRAEGIVLGGLAVQIVFFGMFIVTTIIFHIRILKRPTERSFRVEAPWRQLILALYISSVLIMVRSIFRMIEFGAGKQSILMQKEVFLLALDGALMFLVGVVFLWKFPGDVLVGYKQVWQTTDEETLGSRAEGIPMVAGGKTAYQGVAGGDFGRYSTSVR